ncbi:TMEM14 family protein [Novipirellula maiorica]|nr:TMEM14 family protein [Rhodopirellula maiorica]
MALSDRWHLGGDPLQFGERQLAWIDRCSNPLNHFCQNLTIKSKETCVDFPVIMTAIYGVFVVFGGVMGYVKAQSKASLIAGCITGGLLLLSAFLIARGITVGAILGIVVSLLLIGQFGPSLLKKFKVMPNLLVVVLGLITVGTLLFRFFN